MLSCTVPERTHASIQKGVGLLQLPIRDRKALRGHGDVRGRSLRTVDGVNLRAAASAAGISSQQGACSLAKA